MYYIAHVKALSLELRNNLAAVLQGAVPGEYFPKKIRFGVTDGPPLLSKERHESPLCGVHDVPLVQEKISIELTISNSFPITCCVCPVSKKVVSDPEAHT
jgi:hypothetical protein